MDPWFDRVVKYPTSQVPLSCVGRTRSRDIQQVSEFRSCYRTTGLYLCSFESAAKTELGSVDETGQLPRLRRSSARRLRPTSVSASFFFARYEISRSRTGSSVVPRKLTRHRRNIFRGRPRSSEPEVPFGRQETERIGREKAK